VAFRSGITRGFDLAYPSNRFVLAATPAIGALTGLATLVRGDGWGAAFANGFSAGGAAFVAWALARELHPDRTWVAAVAALVAPWGLLRTGPDLLASAAVLLGARVVAGTTGRGLRWFDVGLFAAVSLPVALRDSGPGVLTPAALALGLVAIRQDRRRLETGVTAALLAGFAVVAWLRFDAQVDVDLWMLVPAVLGLVALAGPGRVAVGTDRAGGTIASTRVRLARLLALVAASGSAVALPAAALAPVWASLTAVALRPR
jgi:hypothetical protein